MNMIERTETTIVDLDSGSQQSTIQVSIPFKTQHHALKQDMNCVFLVIYL